MLLVPFFLLNPANLCFFSCFWLLFRFCILFAFTLFISCSEAWSRLGRDCLREQRDNVTQNTFRELKIGNTRCMISYTCSVSCSQMVFWSAHLYQLTLVSLYVETVNVFCAFLVSMGFLTLKIIVFCYCWPSVFFS